MFLLPPLSLTHEHPKGLSSPQPCNNQSLHQHLPALQSMATQVLASMWAGAGSIVTAHARLTRRLPGPPGHSVQLDRSIVTTLCSWCLWDRLRISLGPSPARNLKVILNLSESRKIPDMDRSQEHTLIYQPATVTQLQSYATFEMQPCPTCHHIPQTLHPRVGA